MIIQGGKVIKIPRREHDNDFNVYSRLALIVLRFPVWMTLRLLRQFFKSKTPPVLTPRRAHKTPLLVDIQFEYSSIVFRDLSFRSSSTLHILSEPLFVYSTFYKH